VADRRVPTWLEFLAALGTVEEWLLAKIAEVREKFPEHAEVLSQLADALRAKQRTMEVLLAIGTELQALSSGKGPVSHDPVDWASLLDDSSPPLDPPGA
jgi:hypothetical protein